MIIFDVGAHWGRTCSKYYSTYKDNNPIIHCFEPDKRNISHFIKNTENIKNHVILNKCAVSNENKTLKLYITKKTACSSLLEPNSDNFKKWKFPDQTCFNVIDTYDVKCITLYDYIVNNNIKKIDILKIDTQGNDFNVIKSLKDKIHIVNQILLEVQVTDYEIYKNQAKKEEVLNYLKEKNFTLTDTQKQTFDQEENLTFINNDI